MITPGEPTPDPSGKTDLREGIAIFNPNPFPVPVSLSILSALNSNQSAGPANIGGFIVQFTTVLQQANISLPAFSVYTVGDSDLLAASGEVINLPGGVQVPIAVLKIDHPDEITRTVNQISSTVKVKPLIFVQVNMLQDVQDPNTQHPIGIDTVVKPME